MWLAIQRALNIFRGLFESGRSDRPIDSLEQDCAGSAQYVAALGHFLANEATKPPLTIAIEGDWGKGKSSLMRLLQQHLGLMGERTIWFNAWHHQSEEQLLSALLETVRQELAPAWYTPTGFKYYGYLIWQRVFKRWPISSALLTALLLLEGWFFQIVLQPEPLLLKAEHQTRIELVPTLVQCLLSGEECDPVESETQKTEPKNAKSGAPASNSKSAAPTNNTPEKLKKPLTQRLAMIRQNDEFLFWIFVILMLSPFPILSLPMVLKLNFTFDNPAILKALSEGIRNPRLLEKETSYRYRFAQEFKEVMTALLPKRLFIFIDDLDRCSPAVVQNMLESTNFLCESGECFIVMGLARPTVETAVGLAFKEIADELGRQGEDVRSQRKKFAKEYLRKLIHVNISVPEIQPAEFHKLFGQNETDQEQKNGYTDSKTESLRQNLASKFSYLFRDVPEVTDSHGPILLAPAPLWVVIQYVLFRVIGAVSVLVLIAVIFSTYQCAKYLAEPVPILSKVKTESAPQPGQQKSQTENNTFQAGETADVKPVLMALALVFMVICMAGIVVWIRLVQYRSIDSITFQMALKHWPSVS